jgi:hypothetical protein
MKIADIETIWGVDVATCADSGEPVRYVVPQLSEEAIIAIYRSVPSENHEGWVIAFPDGQAKSPTSGQVKILH